MYIIFSLQSFTDLKRPCDFCNIVSTLIVFAESNPWHIRGMPSVLKEKMDKLIHSQKQRKPAAVSLHNTAQDRYNLPGPRGNPEDVKVGQCQKWQI